MKYLVLTTILIGIIGCSSLNTTANLTYAVKEVYEIDKTEAFSLLSSVQELSLEDRVKLSEVFQEIDSAYYRLLSYFNSPKNVKLIYFIEIRNEYIIIKSNYQKLKTLVLDNYSLYPLSVKNKISVLDYKVRRLDEELDAVISSPESKNILPTLTSILRLIVLIKEV